MPCVCGVCVLCVCVPCVRVCCVLCVCVKERRRPRSPRFKRARVCATVGAPSVCARTRRRAPAAHRTRTSRQRTPAPPCSPQIFIRVDEQCKVLCRIANLTANQAKAFTAKIEDEYRVLMCVCACIRVCDRLMGVCAE